MAVLAALGLAVAACGGDDTDATGTTTEVPDAGTSTSAGDEVADTTTSSTLPPSVETLAGAAIVLTEVAQVDAPTAMASLPGTDTLYVAERGGAVRPITFTALTGGGSRAEVGPTIVEVDTTTDGERGLLGLTFSPDGEHLYVSYTDPAGNTAVDEFAMAGGADDPTVDVGSRRQIFATEQPFPNHNGGDIGFGPDGYLYLGLGDGGAGGDPLGTAQDPTRVLGSMLRVDPSDPSDGRAYGIPDDNPHADGAGGAQPEIWAIGVRNPWRFSWDRETGAMWIADVGQNAIEEITVLGPGPEGVPAPGANLGWPIFEGDAAFNGGDAPENYAPPIFDYEQGPGCSVTGGFVSRGDALPALRGAYLYSDFCDPTIRALLAADGQLVEERSLEVTVPGGNVASFGQGTDGALYVLSLSGGIYRIDPA